MAFWPQTSSFSFERNLSFLPDRQRHFEQEVICASKLSKQGSEFTKVTNKTMKQKFMTLF